MKESIKFSAAALALAAALAAAGGAAYAQTVTLYGVIDTGVEYLDGVGADKEKLTRVPTITGSVPSRWGLRGSEDLGGGLKAEFVLESGFGTDIGTSQQGGRLFGRQAWLGLSGSWGSVALGRQYSMLFYSMIEADILGPSIYGAGAFDSYIPNPRSDNTISYRGRFGGLTVGATYSLGRDTVNAGPSPSGTNCAGEEAGNSRQCRDWSALLKYDRPLGGVAVAIDEMRGGPGAYGGLTDASLVDRRIVATGYLMLGVTRVGLGFIRRDNDGRPEGPRSDMWFAGVRHPLGAFTLEGQVFTIDYDDSDDEALLISARVQYAFSRRTTLYATGGYINNDGTLNLTVSGGASGSNPAAGGSQRGLMLGMRHSF